MSISLSSTSGILTFFAANNVNSAQVVSFTELFAESSAFCSFGTS